MSLEARLAALATAVGDDVMELREQLEAEGIRFLTEAAGVYPARPPGGSVIYMGTVDPTALMLEGDVWVNNDPEATPPPSAVDSVNGKAGIVVLTKADLGLSNVSNTSDAAKPVSTATAAAISTVAGQIPTFSMGLYAARPAASNGAVYYATDTKETYTAFGSSWIVTGSAAELASATSVVSFTVTAGTGNLDVPGLTVSFRMPERPVYIRFQSVVQNVATVGAVCRLMEGSTAIDEYHVGQQANLNDFNHINLETKITGTAGVMRTFKIIAVRKAAAWAVYGAALYPQYLSAVSR